jgi:hypothetical protein
MKLTVHDLLALIAAVGVLALVLVGKLDPTAALTFVGGLVLRSPMDRPEEGQAGPDGP